MLYIYLFDFDVKSKTQQIRKLTGFVVYSLDMYGSASGVLSNRCLWCLSLALHKLLAGTIPVDRHKIETYMSIM